MKVTLLGTGDAIGTPKIGCRCPACADALCGGRSRRLRFSILVENAGGKVLIDTSPDLRWQLIRTGISRVDGVIWTHAHYDHYAGFGDFHRVQNRVPVYGLQETMDYILNYLYFMRPKRNVVETGVPFDLAGMEFTLFEVNHPPICEAAGVLVRVGSKKLVVTGDTNLSIPEASLEMMRGADLLVADAITPPGYNLNKHMDSEEAVGLGRRLSAKEVVLTHISHLFPPHDVAIKRWPLGFDMMTMEL
ncbi:MBL fold metallo-hydrolase [Methanotrichaceae archaeon M04Ac]|uniref:MBL fold metallo-hydrolase n=1 Tax=Candidatus Methanocrinis alkalitolerans TaxID=3033395 RepID=A0ABT5XF47_9EURY|nr:MBL fold metallo-hydrolase [Candidatus Methanocrinis alkalitolerans]MCR3883865.1 MBL fold metallo-hydrolase [Methanothrix sp.]MDF0593256.1 MBL fold metallo-hydrolase [Candidatus Methanocrinis alkalitolerans]